MTSDKYLVVIGLSEEDEARLRLLMRRAAIDHLAYMWRWGSEDKADLVIVDPTDFAGQMARNRAFSSGKRCAVFSGPEEELRNGELHLPRPMKLEGVAELLNEVGVATAFEDADSIIPNAQNFYEDDTISPGTGEAEEIEEVDLNLVSGAQREEQPAQGLDDLLKPDSAAAKPAFAVPLELKSDTTIEASRQVTARRERRVADSVGGLKKTERPPEMNLSATPSSGYELAPAHAPNKLRDYLRGNLLGGPATMTIQGEPPLTLDPKGRVYHTSSESLRALTPYCKQALPERDWRPLTTAELAKVREEQPAQPYSRLIWLATLVTSAGRLASHLDPGGRYRLKDGAKVETDVPNHARIGHVMRDMAKLNEISAVTGASMSEVFDVINAYDAIHALETERRQSRYDDTAAPAKNTGGGLFAKLRKSLTGR